MKNLTTLASLLLILLVASSCEYQKLLKSSDYERKLDQAIILYGEGKLSKALTLFEQIEPIYKGAEKGEDVLYYIAQSNYKMKDFITAGYYFRRFATTYPNASRSEEASFMSAYCFYLDAPKPSLDQETTHRAIDEFQLFVGRYPNSDRLAEANELIDKLRERLEEKYYINSKLYFDIGSYKAATIAFNNNLKQYPDSKYREESLFYIVKSNYLYAINSITSKMPERLQATQNAYKRINKEFPESQFKKELDRMMKDTKKRISNL